MITAIFNPDTTMANAYGLWQYDYGQTLRIQGLHLPSAVEIHFSLQETGGTSVNRVGVTKDGVTDVIIPDSMLENDGADRTYDMFAFIYLTDATSGQTEYKIKLQVKSRPKPEVFDGGENPNIFHEAVQAVQKSADKASESEKQAEGWAHGREDLPERAQDNAKYYAGQAAADAKKTGTDRKEVERLVESVSGIDEQVVKVENLTKQAQTSATNAALSEQAAKTAETNAQTAQAGAETAEGNAELAERNAKASEQAVEKAKQLVTQMGQEVLNNKNHVDQTVQAFTLTAQQAVADVNNAGQTQTERVEGAGNDAVESVKTAQTAATKAVEAAKTEAVEAVQTEGTTQTRNVSAEGEKQVQAVQAAAQEIVADREQIAQNKADVTALKEDLGNIITTKTSKQLFDDKIAKDNKIYKAVYHSSGMSDYIDQAGWKIIGIPLNIVVNKAIKLRTSVNTNFKFVCFNADGKFSTAIEKTSDSTVSNSDGTYTVTIPYQNWDVINYIAFEFLATGFTGYPIVTYESDYDSNITFFGKVVSLSDSFNVPYLDEEISKVNKKIVNIEEKINVSDNPCDYTGDEICIFGKGLLIGDSLTEGAFDCNESGSQDGFRHATMNYPSNLARITGISFTNKGDAGKTIKAWYEAHKSDDLSGHDFCIIALGVNDVYFNKGWTSDAETYLTNIINKVKTENNKIPIFIATIPMFFKGYEGADFEGMSQHIRTFAESNSLYLVDFRTYFTEFSSDSYTKYGVTYYAHHNALGYYKIAHAYKSYISYIISKNIDDFKNVQFVGTNHSWIQYSSN